MKTFAGDFEKFRLKIERKEPFAIVRFGDGEMMLMNKQPIDLMHKGVGEFKYDGSVTYAKSINMLSESFRYYDPNYFVGIACPCCVGKDKSNAMKVNSGLNDSTLTWANIFVNANYNKTINTILPLFKRNSDDIVLVSHISSSITSLPWKQNTSQFYGVQSNAWIQNLDLIDVINKREYNNKIVIICAGPFANIAVHQLYKHNKNNIYIDFGSVLDPYLGLPVTRGYQLGAPTLNKVCIWE